MAARDANKLAELLAEIGASDLGDLGAGLDELLNAMSAVCEDERAGEEKEPEETFKPETLKSACIADLAPTEEERAILAGRKLLIEYSGGKDSSAAAVWARHYFPDNPTELLF